MPASAQDPQASSAPVARHQHEPGTGADAVYGSARSDGDTIHDRRHPHDLFMELAADYNPAAPISHHWLDSTHIAFGLVTTGLCARA